MCVSLLFPTLAIALVWSRNVRMRSVLEVVLKDCSCRTSQVDTLEDEMISGSVWLIDEL